MNMVDLEATTNVFLIITAIVAIITLVLNIFKECRHAKPIPYRRKLYYENDYGDFIANFGVGVFEITDMKLFLDGEEIKGQSVIDIYTELLGEKSENLTWKTFIRNDEIVNRFIKFKDEIKLVEINPEDYKKDYPKLLDELKEIRDRIKIILKYKDIYGIVRTKEL